MESGRKKHEEQSLWMEGQTKRSLNVCSQECMHTKSKKCEVKNTVKIIYFCLECVSVLECK